MRRLALALSALIVAALAGTSGQQSSSAYIQGEILIQFHPAANAQQRNNALALHGARRVQHYDAFDVDRIELAAGQSVDAAVAAFRGDSNVIAAQPNFIREAIGTDPANDPLWLDGTLWGMQRIQMASVWATSTTGSPTVVVADIDTGINYNHPDLAANVWTNPAEIPGNGIDDDGNGYVDDVHGINVLAHSGDPMDDNGHGTHTAGTIGAVGNNGVGVVGVNWNTSIVACKFLDARGSGSDSGAIECLNYLVALKQRGVNIRVTNDSWGSPRGNVISTLLKQAFDTAGAAGIVHACAAGNSSTNNDTQPFDPASFGSSSIIAVAASDQSDNRASFSNYGLSVHLAAPGVSIASTYGDGYAYLNGTSMATPHVAGAAALVGVLNPSLTPESVKWLLTSTVDVLPQWAGLVSSGGRLNVATAAANVNTVPPPPPPPPPPGPNQLPTVYITAPAMGSSVTAPLTITANASDPDGSIASVSFYANGVFVKSDTAAPFSVQWANPAAGTYTLTAVAIDNQGASSTSSAVVVTVKKKK